MRPPKLMGQSLAIDTEKHPKAFLSESLKHPFFLFVMGFIISGLLGGSVSRYYARIDFERSMESKRIEYAIQIASPAAELLAHAALLTTSIDNNDLPMAQEENWAMYKASMLKWKIQLNEATILGSMLVRHSERSDLGDIYISTASLDTLMKDMDSNFEPIKSCIVDIMRLATDHRKNAINNCRSYNKNRFEVIDTPKLSERIRISESCLAKTQMALIWISMGDDPASWLDNGFCKAFVQSSSDSNLPPAKKEKTLLEKISALKDTLLDPKTYLPE